jgi:hypothetical protein
MCLRLCTQLSFALVLLFFSLVSCNTSTEVEPTVVVLGEVKAEGLEYIVLSPSVLGERLYSFSLSENNREQNWRDYLNKWVLWPGTIVDIEPALKPSSIYIVYDFPLRSFSFQEGKFVVKVNFTPEETPSLKQLSVGDRVYYKAKLRKNTLSLATGRYGVNDGYMLDLQEARLVSSDCDIARLVDLAYSGQQQMDTLIDHAKKITSVMNYYNETLDAGVAWIGAKMMVELLTPLTINDPHWLEQVSSLPDKESLRNRLIDEMSIQVGNVLTINHSTVSGRNLSLQDTIEAKYNKNNSLVESSADVTGYLYDFYQQYSQQSTAGLSDLVKALVKQKLPGFLKLIGLLKTGVEAAIDVSKLGPYETIVGSCYLQLSNTDDAMQLIKQNIVKAAESY